MWIAGGVTPSVLSRPRVGPFPVAVAWRTEEQWIVRRSLKRQGRSIAPGLGVPPFPPLPSSGHRNHGAPCEVARDSMRNYFEAHWTFQTFRQTFD